MEERIALKTEKNQSDLLYRIKVDIAGKSVMVSEYETHKMWFVLWFKRFATTVTVSKKKEYWDEYLNREKSFFDHNTEIMPVRNMKFINHRQWFIGRIRLGIGKIKSYAKEESK